MSCGEVFFCSKAELYTTAVSLHSVRVFFGGGKAGFSGVCCLAEIYKITGASSGCSTRRRFSNGACYRLECVWPSVVSWLEGWVNLYWLKRRIYGMNVP